MKEIWKEIKDYPNYMVSNMGRVKSLNYHRTDKEKILKQEIIKNGYCRVALCKEGKQKKYLVHCLVCTAFLPNPDNLPQVNHKDENKQNNCASNLEYCNAKYNSNYGTKPERISKALKGKPNIVLSKSILQLSKSGNIILRKWDSARQVEKELGINHSNIIQCLKGKYKTCGGYKWMYYEDYVNRMNNYFELALKEVS